MAIVRVEMKSSASAPPSASHADYITRGGKYERRGGVELVMSGNMPEFASERPREFWEAADLHERANGRTYTELLVAVPRELSKEGQQQLVKDAAREFFGDRFAFTVGFHRPMAADREDQPHAHMMFSERAIDERTRTLEAEKFFKRNGAKKDRETWHDIHTPERLRARWCELANAALQREGLDLRLDPRSWEAQGRDDLAALREPKIVRGREAEVAELRAARQLVAQGEVSANYRSTRRGMKTQTEAAIREIEDRAQKDLAPIEKELAQIEAAAKEQQVLKPARDTNKIILDAADQIEKTGRVKLSQDEAYKIVDAVYGPRLDKHLHGTGNGRSLVQNFEIGARGGESRNGLKGLADMVVERLEKGFSYALEAWKGKAAEFAGFLREQAKMQLQWDSKILQRREKQHELGPQKQRTKTHQRSGPELE